MKQIYFSSLSKEFDVPTNPLYAARDRVLAQGKTIVDLVSPHLGDMGIEFPPDLLDRAMAEGLSRSRRYTPDPLGQRVAREAISRFYAQTGIDIAPEQTLITPGTSLAYWYAFRALANEGDEILCPHPGYPLFDGIAATAGVRLKSYLLRAGDSRWELDFDSMEQAINERTRALILVSPHNPTGHVASGTEIQRLVALSVKHALPIVADEVFSPFLFTGQPFARPAAYREPLVITLNGFSKMLALPGLKFGWMAVTGPRSEVQTICKTMEHLSDTFLPVNEAVQRAAPALLEDSLPFQRHFQSSVAERRRRVTSGIASLSKMQPLLVPEGGFYWAFPLIQDLDEEEVCLRLLEKHLILTHPGYFYDLPAPHLVFSFLNAESVFQLMQEI